MGQDARSRHHVDRSSSAGTLDCPATLAWPQIATGWENLSSESEVETTPAFWLIVAAQHIWLAVRLVAVAAAKVTWLVQSPYSNIRRVPGVPTLGDAPRGQNASAKLVKWQFRPRHKKRATASLATAAEEGTPLTSVEILFSFELQFQNWKHDLKRPKSNNNNLLQLRPLGQNCSIKWSGATNQLHLAEQESDDAA